MQTDCSIIPLKKLLDQSSDFIQVISMTGHILYVNQAWQRQLGYSETDVLGVNWLDVVHPSCRDRLALALAEYDCDGTFHDDALTGISLMSKSGVQYLVDGVLEIQSIESHSSATSQLFCLWKRHSSGNAQTQKTYNQQHSRNPAYALDSKANGNRSLDTVLTKIIGKQQSDEPLWLLKSMFTLSRYAVVITEAEPIHQPGPKIIYVNPAFTKITGYSADEVIGQTPRILQGEKTNRATLKQLRQALDNWESIDVELINYRKDGTEFWLEMTIVPVADSTGYYTHWLAIQHDVTERKNLEEELLKSLSKERELSDLKTRFISITSHEFRTPLTSIMSSVEILDYFENTETERRELFDQIYNSIQHLSQLLNDVLFISCADSEYLSLNCEDIDVSAFCLNIISEAEQSFGKNHQFRFHQDGLPTMVCLDPKLLRQILTNLLSNAVKYSDAGSLVNVLLNFGLNTYTVKITDQGIGISEEEQSRLFDFFYRGSNVNDVAGTGLGLAIVKKSVELLHGGITVESQLQQGTTITMTFPLTCQ